MNQVPQLQPKNNRPFFSLRDFGVMGTKNKKMEMVEGRGEGKRRNEKKKRKKNSDVRVG